MDTSSLSRRSAPSKSRNVSSLSAGSMSDSGETSSSASSSSSAWTYTEEDTTMKIPGLQLRRRRRYIVPSPQIPARPLDLEESSAMSSAEPGAAGSSSDSGSSGSDRKEDWQTLSFDDDEEDEVDAAASADSSSRDVTGSSCFSSAEETPAAAGGGEYPPLRPCLADLQRALLMATKRKESCSSPTSANSSSTHGTGAELSPVNKSIWDKLFLMCTACGDGMERQQTRQLQSAIRKAAQREGHLILH